MRICGKNASCKKTTDNNR